MSGGPDRPARAAAPPAPPQPPSPAPSVVSQLRPPRKSLALGAGGGELPAEAPASSSGEDMLAAGRGVRGRPAAASPGGVGRAGAGRTPGQRRRRAAAAACSARRRTGAATLYGAAWRCSRGWRALRQRQEAGAALWRRSSAAPPRKSCCRPPRPPTNTVPPKSASEARWPQPPVIHRKRRPACCAAAAWRLGRGFGGGEDGASASQRISAYRCRRRTVAATSRCKAAGAACPDSWAAGWCAPRCGCSTGQRGSGANWAGGRSGRAPLPAVSQVMAAGRARCHRPRQAPLAPAPRQSNLRTPAHPSP